MGEKNEKDYVVIAGPENLEKVFADSLPFNIRAQYKENKFSSKEIDNLEKEIALILINGIYYPNAIIHRCRDYYKIYIAKIRYATEASNLSKSDGYRIYALVDDDEHYAFVLYIFSKKREKKENITSKDENKLIKLCEQYYKEKREQGDRND